MDGRLVSRDVSPADRATGYYINIDIVGRGRSVESPRADRRRHSRARPPLRRGAGAATTRPGRSGAPSPVERGARPRGRAGARRRPGARAARRRPGPTRSPRRTTSTPWTRSGNSIGERAAEGGLRDPRRSGDRPHRRRFFRGAARAPARVRPGGLRRRDAAGLPRPGRRDRRERRPDRPGARLRPLGGGRFRARRPRALERPRKGARRDPGPRQRGAARTPPAAATSRTPGSIRRRRPTPTT